MSKDYLFVYGTLKRLVNSEIHPFLAIHGEFIETAQCQGKLYLIEDYPGLVTSDDGKDQVDGEVYLILDFEKLFYQLDLYEEYGREFLFPNEFVRRRYSVRLAGGKIINAWLYIYNRPTDGLVRLPRFLNDQRGASLNPKVI